MTFREVIDQLGIPHANALDEPLDPAHVLAVMFYRIDEPTSNIEFHLLGEEARKEYIFAAANVLQEDE